MRDSEMPSAAPASPYVFALATAEIFASVRAPSETSPSSLQMTPLSASVILVRSRSVEVPDLMTDSARAMATAPPVSSRAVSLPTVLE